MNDPRLDNTRVIRSPVGTELSCKSWLTEAPFRMLQNNLDPDVAERPEDLVKTFGTIGEMGQAGRHIVPFEQLMRVQHDRDGRVAILLRMVTAFEPAFGSGKNDLGHCVLSLQIRPGD